jgi:hypothetical protein
MNVTPDGLAVASGILLSLAASYIPGFSDWFGKLGSQYKRLFMLAALAVVALAVVGLSCANLGSLAGQSVTCDQPGFMGALQAFVAAAIANQTAFLLSPQKTPKGE